MKDTVLVTGGAGFIGSHVADHLIRNGFHVLVLDDLSGGFTDNIPSKAEFYQGSILNQELIENIFRRHCPRFVFHLAAYAAEGLSPFIRNFNCRNNIEGSENLITASINHKVECFVFTSSIAAYGNQTPPFHESTPLRPIDPYGAAKTCVEYSLHNAKEIHGLNHVIFRPFNVYGERQNTGDPYRNVVGIFIARAIQGKTLQIFGSGEQCRSFTHVDDVAPAIAAAVGWRECWNSAINIGVRAPVAINRLAQMVAIDLSDHDVKIEHVPQRHEAVEAWCDVEKCRAIFGDIMPNISIEDGLSRTIAWVKQNGIRASKPFANIEIKEKLPPSWK